MLLLLLQLLLDFAQFTPRPQGLPNNKASRMGGFVVGRKHHNSRYDPIFLALSLIRKWFIRSQYLSRTPLPLPDTVWRQKP